MINASAPSAPRHGMVMLQLDGRHSPGSDLDATWSAGARAFQLSTVDQPLSLPLLRGSSGFPARFNHYFPEVVAMIAPEPGLEPAPQTAHAAEVDRKAVDWFRRYLVPTDKARR